MASSLSPSSAITRLQTRMSGQGTGRIGNSAGVLGSRGTPTSMRGRFAKYGSMFGDEVGAMSALATTAQARRSFENGTMRAAMKPEFNADDYEARGRKRRGLQPRAMLPTGAAAQPINQRSTPLPHVGTKPLPPAAWPGAGTGAAATVAPKPQLLRVPQPAGAVARPTAAPMMAAQAPASPVAPLMPVRTPLGVLNQPAAYKGKPNLVLPSSRFNLTGQHFPGFTHKTKVS